MYQNLFKLTSIGMSNLKAVCWTNTYQFLLCSCLTWRQVALCESFLNLHLQRVAIHNCHVLLTSLSQDYLYFLPLFKRTKMQILVAPCLLTPPYMNFEWMVRFRLALCGFVLHSETRTTIRLEGDRAIVAENHVMESVATLQDAFSEFQTLGFVGVTNQLAISSPLQSPALLLSRSRTADEVTRIPRFASLLTKRAQSHILKWNFKEQRSMFWHLNQPILSLQLKVLLYNSQNFWNPHLK